MKNVCILIAFVSAWVTAQDLEKVQPSFSVYGLATYEVEAVEYKLTVTLSLADAQYGGVTYTGVEEMKQEYLKKLSQSQLNTASLVENKMDYLTSGRRGDGTTLQFITSDKKEFERFLLTTLPGVYVASTQYRYRMKGKSHQEVMKEALSDAEENAIAMANAAGKKLGKIVGMNALELPKEGQWSYYNHEAQFRILVFYELLGS